MRHCDTRRKDSPAETTSSCHLLPYLPISTDVFFFQCTIIVLFFKLSDDLGKHFTVTTYKSYDNHANIHIQRNVTSYKRNRIWEKKNPSENSTPYRITAVNRKDLPTSLNGHRLKSKKQNKLI